MMTIQSVDRRSSQTISAYFEPSKIFEPKLPWITAFQAIHADPFSTISALGKPRFNGFTTNSGLRGSVESDSPVYPGCTSCDRWHIHYRWQQMDPTVPCNPNIYRKKTRQHDTSITQSKANLLANIGQFLGILAPLKFNMNTQHGCQFKWSSFFQDAAQTFFFNELAGYLSSNLTQHAPIEYTINIKTILYKIH